ncbi:MAG: thioredoxin-like domain-containing protein [Prevotella sp.]|nr:thioredoxin-like domain-containing protein [Prevotella sp.]
MNISKLFTAAGVAVIMLAAVSCTEKKFNINGSIAQANDSVLYLENIGIDGITAVDSLKLGENGDFSFSHTAPEAPEFYRLRISDQIINISIDSTETVTVKADYPTMAQQYTVEGSEESNVIKELSAKQMQLREALLKIENNEALSYQVAGDSIMKVIEAYKDDIKNNYIFKNPNKASSYFALFQTIGSYLIFNPRENEADIKAFAAVATSWDVYYPEAVRGKNLHNIAIEGMKNIRLMQNKQAASSIDLSQIEATNIINVSLLDNKGNLRNLTDLKGKVVMLDFHIYGGEASTKRIMLLRELYSKYNSQGFEIYQVGLNDDEHFWKTQTEALPWICVHDKQGANSVTLRQYNVQSIPTFFLIDKTNTLHKRDLQIEDIDAEIKSLL